MHKQTVTLLSYLYMFVYMRIYVIIYIYIYMCVRVCLMCACVVSQTPKFQIGLSKFALEPQSQGFLRRCEDTAAGDGGKHDSRRCLT